MEELNWRSVARLIALWRDERTPLHAAEGLYKQAVELRGQGGTYTEREYVAAAEEIIGAHTLSEHGDLIDTTLAQLDSIEASRRKLSEPEPVNTRAVA